MTPVTGPVWGLNIVFFIVAISFGVAFIATSPSKSFYKWRMNSCAVTGTHETGQTLSYNISLTVDIGWREITATHVDSAAGQYCFEDIVEQGEVYAISDFEDNSAGPAGLGMVAAWALAVLVALFTIVAMLRAIGGNYKGVNLVKLMNLTILMTLGMITSTTVFWWMVEGKFGSRMEALVPRLRDLVLEAAERCNDDEVAPCNAVDYHIITPGLALAFGITSIFLYGVGALMLWMMAARVQSLNNVSADDTGAEAAKVPTGDFIVEKQTVQAEDKLKAKDGRSAKTGVRSAPNSTVRGELDNAPDPMTYALEEGSEEEAVADDDEEDEVMYKNHQVHHNVINHSQANRTQEVVDSRHQQQYQRGYSRGTSGNSYRSGMGGQSFEERSEGDFSDASSARYYGQNQGRYRSESSSRGDSFDESR